MVYHFIPTRMAGIKTSDNNKDGEDVEKLEPSSTAGWNI